MTPASYHTNQIKLEKLECVGIKFILGTKTDRSSPLRGTGIRRPCVAAVSANFCWGLFWAMRELGLQGRRALPERLACPDRSSSRGSADLFTNTTNYVIFMQQQGLIQLSTNYAVTCFLLDSYVIIKVPYLLIDVKISLQIHFYTIIISLGALYREEATKTWRFWNHAFALAFPGELERNRKSLAITQSVRDGIMTDYCLCAFSFIVGGGFPRGQIQTRKRRSVFLCLL